MARKTSTLHWLFWGILAGAVMVGLIGIALSRPLRHDAIMAPGQTYDVLWSCLAQIGCYGEVVHALETRSDGFVKVRNMQDSSEWWIRPDTTLAFRIHEEQGVVLRAHGDSR